MTGGRIMRAGILTAAVVLAALTLSGCDSGSGQPAPGAAPAPAVDVTPADSATLDAALAENKGHVVAVDFWAWWCGPCVEKFPHLVELHHKYSAKGLVCISVSMDKDVDQTLSFLREQKATFPNYILSEPTTAGRDKVRERFQLGATIPHMAVFGRDGALIWAGNMSPAAVERLIQRALSEG